MKLILVFIFLQLADFATTLEVISLGGVEKNPIVGHFMGLGVSEGLAVAKLIALGVGLVASFSGKHNSLRKLNVAFTAIVVWNLSIIGRLVLA